MKIQASAAASSSLDVSSSFSGSSSSFLEKDWCYDPQAQNDPWTANSDGISGFFFYDVFEDLHG